MPDIVVHNAMGDIVLSKLDTEIVEVIDCNIFRFALMGPDVYMYYRFFAMPFRRGINSRSKIMHTSRVNEFLMALATRSQSRETFSFLAGFLSHYALDSITHPLICELAGNRSGMHTAIERRLDVIELERQGKQPKDILGLLAKCPDIPEIRDVIRDVYGWDDNHYLTATRHMHMYYWIAKDQNGILNSLLHKLPGKLASVSYRATMADDVDPRRFVTLEAEAVEKGCELVKAAFGYRNGRISAAQLREIIGNRSYL